MIKVLFVCLGNICRSPMAEFVFKQMVKERNLQDSFYISSAATSDEAAGCNIHRGTREKLRKEGVEFSDHFARKMTPEDYKAYDYILVMEQKNLRDIMGIIGKDSEKKVFCLLDFCGGGDIADPWYTGNFDDTYSDILKGCEAFLKAAVEKHELV